MEAYWGVEVQPHTFLTSPLDEGEWSASRSSRFTRRERALWYPMDRRLGGPQSRSGGGGEEKNSQLLPGLELPIIHPVAQCYTTELSGRIKSLVNRMYETPSLMAE
jgi:hypothetical protein